MKIIYGLYARKSSEREDRQVQSVADQIRELKETAARGGFSTDIILREEHSAKIPGTRPEFTKLLRLIDDGKINGILVWSPNRISRNALDAAAVIDRMDKGKLLSIRMPTKEYLNTPSDKFQLSLELGIGKYENDRRGEDTARGLRGKILRGEQIGRAQYGYETTRDLNTGRPGGVRLKEPQASIRREFYEQYGRGKGLTSIYDDYRARGIEISYAMPSEWLDEPAILYALGCNVSNYNKPDKRLIVENAHDALITPETAERVRHWRKFRAEKHHAKTGTGYKHCKSALTGLLVCGVCGHAMGPREGGSTKKYAYFGCRHKASQCKNDMIRQEILDDVITRRALDEYSNPARFAELIEEMRRREAQDVLSKRINALEHEDKQLTQQIDNLLDRVSKIPHGLRRDIDEKLSRFNDRREAIRRELAEKRNAKLDDIDAAHVAENVRRMVQGVEPGNREKMRTLLHTLIDRIVISPKIPTPGGGWCRAVEVYSKYKSVVLLSRTVSDKDAVPIALRGLPAPAPPDDQARVRAANAARREP